MNKLELLKLIDKLNDEDDVIETLVGTEIEDKFKTEVTLDVVKQKFKSDKDFKSFLDSENDKYHQKAIKTMKEKGTWENEFVNELKIKFPDIVTDPKDKKLLELQGKINQMEKESQKQKVLQEAMKYASDKKLPQIFVENFLGEDIESTKANLDTFGTEWGNALKSAVENKIKSSIYIPPSGDDQEGNISIGSTMAQRANKKAQSTNDPWSTK